MPKYEESIKTRQEKKGRDKQGGNLYSSKHVRIQADLAEKRKGKENKKPLL
jgi:hypothetical protein